VSSAASTAEPKFFHSWEALGTIESCDWRSRGAGLEENLAHLTIEERFGKILKRLLRERFYFEVYVVATELRRRMLATAAPHFSGFSLTAAHRKDSNETATKGA